MDPLAQYAIVFLVVLLVAYQIIATRFAVMRIERKLAHLAARLGVDTAELPPLSDRAKELAREPGGKIAAIRQYREDTGLGLFEAKTAVEQYLGTLDV